MNSSSLSVIKPLKNTHFWLLAIAGGLIAIHLSLSWKSDPNLSGLSMSVLCWGAVLTLLWEKRQNLRLESDILSSLIGLLLIAFVLIRSLVMTSFDSVFELTPFIAGLGLAMLASGVKRLPQYWQELLLILALNAPLHLLINRISILSLYTAKFATLILTYLGFQVHREGVYISLPSGIVEVAAGCSGWESIFPLLKLAVLFLVMFPTNLTKKILVPFVAVAIAFVVNGVRVAIMAALYSYSHPETFKYWHTGTGSQIFFLISTLLFGGFCYLISQNQAIDSQQPREISNS